MRFFPFFSLISLLSGCGFFELAGDLKEVGDEMCAQVDEVCDGVDNDCDGEVDEDATDPVAWFKDADGDGYGIGQPKLACDAPSGGWADIDGDCDDAQADANPGLAEDRYDGVDNDCDTTTGDTCGENPPTLDSISVAYDETFNFGNQTLPAITIDFSVSDADNDLDILRWRVWTDDDADGVVDTLLEPAYDSDWYVVDDGVCALGNVGMNSSFSLEELSSGNHDVAVEITDFEGHASEIYVTQVRGG